MEKGSVKNMEKYIEKARKKVIDTDEDLLLSVMVKILDLSKDKYDILSNAYYYGYMQGRNAMKREIEEKAKKL